MRLDIAAQNQIIAIMDEGLKEHEKNHSACPQQIRPEYVEGEGGGRAGRRGVEGEGGGREGGGREDKEERRREEGRGRVGRR